MTTAHVLLCTLGPVQDFIHTARRCQDLWFGSMLLSELSLAAAEAIGVAAGAEAIVFPGGRGSSSSGVANRVLAVLPAGVDPTEVAKAADSAHRRRLEEVSDRVFRLFDVHNDSNVDLRTARTQVAELMEWVWVAVPIGASGYGEARHVAERWLSAQKARKQWGAPGWNPRPGLPKSSLDGERESVLREAIFDRRKPQHLQAPERRRRYGIKGAERLCGVGLLKRLGADRAVEVFGAHAPRFHSTSHVAMGPVLSRIWERDLEDEVQRYLRTLSDHGLDLNRFVVDGERTLGGHDGVLLLESRLDDHFAEQTSSALTDAERTKAVDAARVALRGLLRSAYADDDSSGSSEPCPYYAFMLADGDRMGKAIDALHTEADHRTLSESLNRFAGACAEVVAAHHGSLIFAGGDDVMALLPLHTAVRCAHELSVVFEEAVGEVAQELGIPSADRPTLSVGLGILHCRDDMADARRLAARAERLAKQSRNSLAVVVSKRSGSDLEVAGPWSEHPPLHERLEAWSLGLQAGSLSRKTSHDLAQVADQYTGLTGLETIARSEEILASYRYVCRAKNVSGGGRPVDREVREVLDAAVGASAITMDPSGGDVLERLHAVVSEIQVADLLSRAARDAGLEVEAR